MRTRDAGTGVRVLIFRDGTWRCVDCKGFGLVRAHGPRSGEHYKSLNGAQTAMDRGNAKDCPVCGGLGLLGVSDYARQLSTPPEARELAHAEGVRMGVRGAQVREADYDPPPF